MNMRFGLLTIIYAYFLVHKVQLTCTPITEVPRLYTTDVSIVKFNRDVYNQPWTQYNYIHNIPVELLQTAKAWQFQCLISLDSLQWTFNPNFIRLMISKFFSQTAILISFRSEKIMWEFFNLRLLINDYKYRPQIYLGQLKYKGTQQNQNNITQQIQLPSNNFTKFTSFITGIHMSLISPFDTQYEISVKQEKILQNSLYFQIQTGNNTFLQQILISYVAIVQSTDKDYMTVSGSFILGVTPSGITYTKLNQCLPFHEQYIFGLSQLKIKQLNRPFGLHFQSIFSNLMSVKTLRPFDFLRINYIGIGVTSQKACENCSIQKYAYSEKAEFCLPKCPSDTKMVISGSQKMCLKCHSQLNMQMRNGECVCIFGYQQYEGYCIPQSSYQNFAYGATFSVSENDCLGKQNIVFNGKDCVCKDGYKQNNQGVCITKCPHGYWKNNQCISCPINQFPSKYEAKCVQCAQNCVFCQNSAQCSLCQPGFSQNQQGGCSQVCGDGMNFNSQCDDNNTNDFDGCSSDCKQQSGYICSGGSFNQPDVCRPIVYSFEQIKNERQIRSGGLVIVYRMNPVNKFTEHELKNNIKIMIEGISFVYHTYIAQDKQDPSKIQIFISFLGNNLTKNIKVYLDFSLSKETNQNFSDTLNIQLYSTNSFASSRLQSRSLS